MPVIVVQGAAPVSPGPRPRITLALNAEVNAQRVSLPLYAATARVRQRAALSLSAVTLDLTALDLPTPALLPGTVQHGAAPGYLITHTGLPALMTDYSITAQNGMPVLTASMRGKVAVSGSLSVVATATPLAGGKTYRAAYGPFNHINTSYTQTPSGWVTKIVSADTTEKDVTATETALPEYLPWEVEKDLTPLQAALKAKDDAALARKLKDVRCPDKPPPDRRSVYVHTLIWWVLGQLPSTIPYMVLAPLPFPGDLFWASQDTGVSFNGGVLNGVSYQTKGKKPLDVVRDILGRAGWQVTLKAGTVLIGPPAPLLSLDASAGELDVPMDLLTEYGEELVNVDAGLATDPQSPSGSFDLPSMITLHLATSKKYLAPLPDQPPEDTFELARDMTLAGSSSVVSPDLNGVSRTESITRWTKTKAGGLLVSETSITDGMVPDIRIDLAKRQVQLESWQERENKTTTYSYADPIYPKAQTGSLSVTRAYVEYLRAEAETERVQVSQEWHEKGYLRRKTTQTTRVESFSATFGTGPGGVVSIPIANTQKEVETEEWLPSKPGWWLHTVNNFRTRVFPVYQGNDSATVIAGGSTETVTNEETDQGPPRAPEGACKADTPEGFPYDDPLDAVMYTGGRSDPVEVDIPWARSAPAYFFENTVAQAARPARRLTYTTIVPPRVRVGGPVKEFSASGSNGRFEAKVTVEEEVG